ncbi:MAG: CopG family transcriptional regulator [Terriglobia bacterium]
MKRKTTVYLDDALLRALKVAAARSGQHEYQVLEHALRSHLGLELLGKVGAKSTLGEKEALDLAYGELHRSRKR